MSKKGGLRKFLEMLLKLPPEFHPVTNPSQLELDDDLLFNPMFHDPLLGKKVVEAEFYGPIEVIYLWKTGKRLDLSFDCHGDDPLVLKRVADDLGIAVESLEMVSALLSSDDLCWTTEERCLKQCMIQVLRTRAALNRYKS